jgi:UDP-N-acetyl-D-mannosaminuronate dehydrogenase
VSVTETASMGRVNQRRALVAIIGVGHVVLPLAVGWADKDINLISGDVIQRDS